MNLVETVGIQGRDREVRELNDSLIKGANILIVAPLGYGKTELYHYVMGLADDYEWFYLELKDILFSSAVKKLIRDYHNNYYNQFHLHPNTYDNLSNKAKTQIARTGKSTWSNLSQEIGKTDLDTLCKIISYSLHWKNKKQPSNHKPILFIKNLKKITEANMSILSLLLQQFQIVAILDRKHAHLPHITILTNNFQSIYELNPIPFDASKLIIIEWLKFNQVEFEGDNVRENFIKQISRDSGGNVGVIAKLLEKSLFESKKINKSAIRRYESDNVQYISMYPVAMIMVAIGSAMRMLGRELDDQVLIITGIICGVVLLIMFLMKSTVDKNPKD